jgi:excisionase family DNA binding protein
MARACSTGEAAKRIGISRQTLQAWIERKRIPAPKLERIGNGKIRLWTRAQIEKARKFKGTLKPGRKPKRKK